MIAFRPGDVDDRSVIVPLWSSTFKRSHFAGMIWTTDWAGIMHDQLTKLLDRAGTRTVVAYESNDPDHVYGFLAGDDSDKSQLPIVHYVYVKEPYRRGRTNLGMRAGIATQLLREFGLEPSSRFVYTFRTGVVRKLLDRRLIPNADWNPLAARYPKEEEREPVVEHRRRRS